MCLQKAAPTREFAANRGGIKPVPAANVVDRRIAQPESEIGQSPDNAVAAPARVLLDEFDDEILKFRLHRWSAEGIGFGKGPFFSDESLEPAKQSVGCNERRELSKAPPANKLGSTSKPNSLGVGEAPRFSTELFKKDAIFFLEVSNHGLLVSVHPTSDGYKKELELSCHGAESLSKVAAAQCSGCSAGFFGSTA